MKKTYFFAALTALFFAGSAAAQYCTPPILTSGPFTGILNVNFGGIDNTTLGTVGYADFTTGTAGSVQQGATVPISIEVEHTLLNGSFSDMVDLRVWIDWNQDQDFDDAGEEMVSQLVDVSTSTGSYNTATYNGNIVVPAGATVGSTRMRVYEDMLPGDGHQTPTTCGYAGQHGECEDYSLTVTSSGGASIQENGNISILNIFPNPIVDNYTIQFDLENTDEVTIGVYNMLGQTVSISTNNYGAGINTITMGASLLEKGVYVVSISTTNGRITKEVTIL